MLAWQKVSSESMNVRNGTVSDHCFLKHDILNDQGAASGNGWPCGGMSGSHWQQIAGAKTS